MLLRRLSILLGSIVLLLLPVWYFQFLPLATALPVHYSQTADLSHSEENRFEIGGTWSGKTISISNTTSTVDKTEFHRAFVTSRFLVQSLTGELLFSLNQKFETNRITMRNYPAGNDNEGTSHVFFPRHLKKETIKWWPETFGEAVDLIYTGTTKIQDLNVYRFIGERKDIDDSAGYAFLPLVPEKYLALSKANLEVFVEPVSGTVIDYQDNSTSYYSGADHKVIWDIAKRSNKFSDSTVTSRINQASEVRQQFFLLEVIIPLLALLTSLIFFNYGVSRKTSHKIKK